MSSIPTGAQDTEQRKRTLPPCLGVRIVETPAVGQPQSRLVAVGDDAHSSLMQEFGQLKAERDLTIAVGETTAGKLIFAANEDSPKMRGLLQGLARKYQGHAIYRNDVRAFARLLGDKDRFSIRQFHDAEAQIAFLEFVYKEHCLELRSMAATRLICDKCFQEYLVAQGIEPVTLVKGIAKQNMAEFRFLMKQPATDAATRKALQELRQTSRLKRKKPGDLPPGLVPRGAGLIKMGSWILLAAELLKLGFEIYEGVTGLVRDEKAAAEREFYRVNLAEFEGQLEGAGLVLVPLVRRERREFLIDRHKHPLEDEDYAMFWQAMEDIDLRLSSDWALIEKNDTAGIVRQLTETHAALQEQLNAYNYIKQWVFDKDIHLANPEGILQDTLWPSIMALEKATKDTQLAIARYSQKVAGADR